MTFDVLNRECEKDVIIPTNQNMKKMRVFLGGRGVLFTYVAVGVCRKEYQKNVCNFKEYLWPTFT